MAGLQCGEEGVFFSLSPLLCAATWGDAILSLAPRLYRDLLWALNAVLYRLYCFSLNYLTRISSVSLGKSPFVSKEQNMGKVDADEENRDNN